MKRSIKPIPYFKTEAAERNFWAKHDATDYFDMNQAEKVIFPNLKPSTETISLRLPVDLLNNIKNMAHQQDMPYQSLMKHLLVKKLQEELRVR